MAIEPTSSTQSLQNSMAIFNRQGSRISLRTTSVRPITISQPVPYQSSQFRSFPGLQKRHGSSEQYRHGIRKLSTLIPVGAWYFRTLNVMVPIRHIDHCKHHRMNLQTSAYRLTNTSPHHQPIGLYMTWLWKAPALTDEPYTGGTNLTNFLRIGSVCASLFSDPHRMLRCESTVSCRATLYREPTKFEPSHEAHGFAWVDTFRSPK